MQTDIYHPFPNFKLIIQLERAIMKNEEQKIPKLIARAKFEQMFIKAQKDSEGSTASISKFVRKEPERCSIRGCIFPGSNMQYPAGILLIKDEETGAEVEKLYWKKEFLCRHHYHQFLQTSEKFDWRIFESYVNHINPTRIKGYDVKRYSKTQIKSFIIESEWRIREKKLKNSKEGEMICPQIAAERLSTKSLVTYAEKGALKTRWRIGF